MQLCICALKKRFPVAEGSETVLFLQNFRIIINLFTVTLRLVMDQSVLSGTCNSIFNVEIASVFLKRAPPQLCNLFGWECNSTEVTKNRNGRQATKGIGMAIWPQKE